MSSRVLIVEDSPVMRQVLTRTVAGEHVSFDEAPDGVAALKAIRSAKTPYDLIFLDLNLPVMDGVKLLSFLRNEPAAANTKVAVVTTEGEHDTEEHVRALGAAYFLRKPVTKHDVLHVLHEVVGHPDDG